jgi:hypothetical protein
MPLSRRPKVRATVEVTLKTGEFNKKLNFLANEKFGMTHVSNTKLFVLNLQE